MSKENDKSINEVVLSKNMISVTLKSNDILIDVLCQKAVDVLEKMCGKE